MSIVKKSFSYETISNHIKKMKLSSKSQRLLLSLFNGDAQEAAKILENFSFTATSDLTMVLIPAAFLVCAYKTKYAKINDSVLKKEMDQLLRQMGSGNRSKTKLSVEDPFAETIKHVLAKSDIKDPKKISIVKSIVNRIYKISKWRHSANNVREHIIPIFEQVLSNGLYTIFYIAFNKGSDLSLISSASIENDDGISTLAASHIPHYMVEKLSKKLDIKDLWIGIVKKNGSYGINQLINSDGYKRTGTTGKNSIPIYYKIDDYSQTDNTTRINIKLSESDVLRVLRKTNGNKERCSELLIEYTENQLQQIKDEIQQKEKL